MRKLSVMLLVLVLLAGSVPFGGTAYAAELSAGTKAELITKITEQIQRRSETFTIHYKGAQNLLNEDILNAVVKSDGTELDALLTSAYGLESIKTNYSYFTGTDIRFTFTVVYDYSVKDLQKLEADQQQWVDAHISSDMDPALKAALVTRYLSDHLRYELNDGINNAYDGYYGQKTACTGYATLAWQLLKKAGVEVKLIEGYIPAGLTDTEYLARSLTVSDYSYLRAQKAASVLQNFHVWNLVRINGRWQHLDTTWVDGDATGEPEGGGYYTGYFLGSDADFGRNHLWVHPEYPAAATNWWDTGSEDLKRFMKAWFSTRIYDYPKVSSLQELNTYAENAHQTGRGSQEFRISQGVQPYDELPILGSARSKVVASQAQFRVAPRNPGDEYILTLEYQGREPEAREELPALKTSLQTVRGASFSPVELLAQPELSGRPPVEWVSLSPTLLEQEGEAFRALKEGRGYIGVYTRDEAEIIPIAIEAPPLQVELDGRVLALNPSPVILDGRTLVPLRGLFEAMDAEVQYDAPTRTITAVRGGQNLVLTLDRREALINGKTVQLDVPPQIINSRTFVPARLAAESFGASVRWDGPANRVVINDSAH